jgi:uncharacterized membrane protein YhaH (DUF805 family)
VRGKVLRVNPDSGSGMVLGDDGERYPFGLGAFRNTLGVGDLVDFVGLEARATDILVLQSAAVAAVENAPAPVAHPAEPGVWACFRRAVTRRYADARGRASRKEYWSFILISWLFVLAPVGLGLVLDAARGRALYAGGPLTDIGFAVAGVIFLGLFVPAVCVLIRRFHDTGRSGWVILIGLIPYLGAAVTVLISLLPSDPNVNRYGRIPAFDV